MKSNEYAGLVTTFGAKVAKHESLYSVSLLTTATELKEKPYLASGKTVIQIDTLRNSTSITVALAAGAASVRLYSKGTTGLETLRQEAAIFDGPTLLAGEVEGQPIPGFQCGNSPLEFTRDKVRGKHIFYSSTNNGMALQNLTEQQPDNPPKSVFWACMLNGRSIGKAMATGTLELPVLFLCAGFRGTLAMEDLLCAGQIMLTASFHGLTLGALDDGATAALRLAEVYFNQDGTCKDVDLLGRDMRRWRCGSVLHLLSQEDDIDVTISGKGLDIDTLAAVQFCFPMLVTDNAKSVIVEMSCN